MRQRQLLLRSNAEMGKRQREAAAAAKKAALETKTAAQARKQPAEASYNDK